MVEKAWESWGTTAGGTVYSLNPLDQARILAVQFQRLVQQLVEAEVPTTVFLAFPRLVEDWGLLCSRNCAISCPPMSHRKWPARRIER